MMRLWVLLMLGMSASLGWGQQGVSREVMFASDGLMAVGTLEVPAGAAGKAGWPLVVMVQGSGPLDRDETIGPNKGFKDLADGLAAHGVASLRYDKRTWLMRTGKIKLSPGDAAKISLAVEVRDDAVAALGYGSTLPEIDGKRIFLLGHSLGGTLAPEIAAERMKAAKGSVRGVILLSAGAIPVNALLPLQITFQGLLRGGNMADVQKRAAKIEASMTEALDPATAADKMELSAPAGYWREWANTDAAAGLKALGLPALVLHGQKDVQVTYLDYVLMCKAATVPGSKCMEFAGLNHLFMAVADESTGDEYMQAGHVAAEVAETIAAWLPH